MNDVTKKSCVFAEHRDVNVLHLITFKALKNMEFLLQHILIKENNLENSRKVYYNWEDSLGVYYDCEKVVDILFTENEV